MALVCPQRDALEALEEEIIKWPEDHDKNRAFRLPDGTPLHLLGVSLGASARKNPNLHIAVFGFTPPKGHPQDAERFVECRFGALLNGPEQQNLFTVEGLNFESSAGGIAILSRNGHSQEYRSI